MSDGARRGILATLAFHVLLAAGAIGLSGIADDPRVPPDRTPAEVERLLDGVLEEHRVVTSKPPGCLFGRNESVWRLYLKARLLTLAYPNITEGLLLERTAASRPLRTRALSIDLLGELCRTGRTNLEVSLQAFAIGPDPVLAGEALRCLFAVDTTGRFLELYRSRGVLESGAAREALSCWVDPTTIQDMERTVLDSPGNQWPECNRRFIASEVLVRLRILASPDCDATLERILEGRDGSDRFEWALKVARTKSMPGLLDALRRRLHRVESPLSADVSEEERYDYARMVETGSDPVRRVKEGRYFTEDEHFDDALIAYAELGGALHDEERRRLTLFGYLGDPRARLDEMLQSEETPR